MIKRLMLIALALSLLSGVAFAKDGPVGEFVEGEVLVVLEATGVPSASNVLAFKTGLEVSANALASSVGAKSVGTFSAIAAQTGKNIAHFRAEGKTTAELMEELKSQPGVLGVSPNYVFHASALPNDPYYVSGDLWGMTDIGAPNAWDICSGDKSVFVAVIDTGIKYDHPDLAANVSKDKDDQWGFNAVANNRDPMDDEGHGSHVAGTIGAVGNNGIGVVGVNWSVSMLGVKVLNDEGSGTGDQIVAGLNYVVAQKGKGLNIKVANMSLGGWSSPINNLASDPYALAHKAISDAGILLVVASGNEGQDLDNPTEYNPGTGWVNLRGLAAYPACFQFNNMITVGAISSDHTQAYFSNHSSNYVHLAAPGVGIWSTVVGDSYDKYGGTSMATPHVAGAAALIAAYRPDLTAGKIKSRILANVTANGGLAGQVVTRGNLNLYNALVRTTTKVDVTSIVVSPSQKTINLQAGTTATLSATLSPAGATNKMVVWSSSNPSVATVSGNGVVKGISSGTTTIYAKSNDGTNVGGSATVTVVASEPAPDPDPDPTPRPVIPVDEVTDVIVDSGEVSSNTGVIPLSNQQTTDLVNGNPDLVDLFNKKRVAQILAVAMDISRKDVDFSVKSEEASFVVGIGVRYQGSLPVTPIIAQLKKTGSDRVDRVDISLPKDQITALMSSSDKISMTFRFKVKSKDLVMLLNGRNLVAEGLALIEEDGSDGFVFVVVISNGSEPLTFNDLSGTLFSLMDKADFFKSTLSKIHSGEYLYQDLVNLELQNLDPNRWSEYRNVIDKQFFPTVEDIQRVINNVNPGVSTSSGGGGCSVGLAPMSLMLFLPLLLLHSH